MSENPESRRILVVDDDPEVGSLLQRVLASYGYQVDLADDLSLLRASREHLPDLILLDLFMPSVSGAEAVRHLFDLPETSDIPIVLMSGASDVAERAERLGVAGYLAKPFDLDTLLKVVTRTLRR